MVSRRLVGIVLASLVVVLLLGMVLLPWSSSEHATAARVIVSLSGSGDQRSQPFVVSPPRHLELKWSSQGPLQFTIVGDDGTPIEPGVSCSKTCTGQRTLRLQPGRYHLDVSGAVHGVDVGELP